LELRNLSSEHAEEEAGCTKGGADYWSFLARIKLLHMSDADRLAHISDVMTRALGILGGAKMKNARSLATYSVARLWSGLRRRRTKRDIG